VLLDKFSEATGFVSTDCTLMKEPGSFVGILKFGSPFSSSEMVRECVATVETARVSDKICKDSITSHSDSLTVPGSVLSNVLSADLISGLLSIA
jgi:hypothetical protein